MWLFAGDLDDFVNTMPAEVREGGLTLRDVAGGRVFGMRSHISRGEVVGFTGNLDSGLSSLGPLIAGAFPGGGEILVDGKVVKRTKSSSRPMVEAKVAFIPQDRHGLGLATPLTVEENVTIPHLRTRGKWWWTGRKWLGFRERQPLIGGHQQTSPKLQLRGIRPSRCSAQQPCRVLLQPGSAR